MINIMKSKGALFSLVLGGSVVVAGLASGVASAASNCATWGCGAANYTGGVWNVSVDDTAPDNKCVKIATISRTTGQILSNGPTSCGPVMYGQLSGNGNEIVRIIRSDGQYKTIVH